MKNRGGTGLRHLRTLFSLGSVAALSDGQLLERFSSRGGEAAEMAFAALVDRHGPMVLRVCRVVLADQHDAHDAFQATFLILVRRAGSIRRRDSLASWLHGVAYRTACCTRSATARRRRHERQAAEMAAQTGCGEWPDDLAPALQAEIHRLPERYRVVVVLCLLEGLTREQAARQLDWPVGTVQSRLARGRELLRARLVRRGLAPALGILGVVGSSEAMAALPSALFEITVGAMMLVATDRAANGVVAVSVISHMEGVLKMMMLAKLKVVACGLLSLAASAVGAGAILGQESSQAPKAAVAGGAVPVPDGVRQPPVDPTRAQVQDRIRLALRQRLDAQTWFYREGRLTVDRLLEAIIQFEEAEFMAAGTEAARLAAVESLVNRIEQLDREEQMKFEAGQGTTADVDEVRQRLEAARVRQAELRLLEAATRRLESQSKSFQAGQITVDRLLDAMSQLSEAEMKYAPTRVGRRTALESLIRNFERLLRNEHAKLEAGLGTTANVNEVRARLENARLQYAEEREGT